VRNFKKNHLSKKAGSLTCRRLLVYPVDKGTNSSEYGKVVGVTVFVTPTHSSTKNPSSTLVAYEWSATVTLRRKTKLKPFIIAYDRVAGIKNHTNSRLAKIS